MESNFIVPKPSNLLIGSAKLLVKGHGLALLKPKFFQINTRVAGDEQTVFASGSGVDTYDKTSAFGTPLFDIVTIQAVSYEDENGKTVNLSKFDLDIVLAEVSKPRNIVVTKIAGKSGSVKEYMSDGDYEISLKGSLINPLAFSSPAQLIRDFDQITKAPKELRITSNFLGYFEIFTIVITHSKAWQREGERNVCDFELTALSDTPFEIQSENESTYKTRSTASF